MSSKKKGRGNKLSRMSEEEKMRYLHHKAAMEKESQNRKQHLICTYLKNKLQHEERFSKLNTAKINQQWRQILRQIKNKELKDDLETLKQRFEVVLTCKNKIIQQLTLDFDDAANQFNIRYQAHVEIIGNFTKMHQTRLDELHISYKNELGRLMEYRANDKETLLQKLTSEIDEIQEMSDTNEIKSEENIKFTKEKFLLKENDTQTTALYNLHLLNEKFSIKMSEMQKEYQNIITQYKLETGFKATHYKVLLQKDTIQSQKIKQYQKTKIELVESIKQAKKENSSLMEENERLKNEEEFEYNRLKKEFQKLQKKEMDEKSDNRIRLRNLTTISNKVIKELTENLETTGLKIMRTIQCNKLRTDQQNLSPNINQSSTPTLEHHKVENSGTKEMRHFWENYNKTKINCEFLKTQFKSNLEENKRLKNLLKEFLSKSKTPCSIPHTYSL